MVPFLKQFRPSRSRAYALPAGERIYAIGDVHGRCDLLEQLLDVITEDDAARGAAQSTIVLLGDLINRGPDSAGVVRRARKLCVERGVGRLVKGNHEETFVKAAKGSGQAARGLWQMGGAATLMSYGISAEEAEHGTFQDLADLLVQRIPREDVDFLDQGENCIELGDYLFVHAGIRPGVPVAEQSGADLRWIRDRFLKAKRNDGLMVIHGHTPTPEIDEQPDRIGVDTGAFMSGVLSAVGIEGTDRWFLEARDRSA